jgi:hypothetical protein
MKPLFNSNIATEPAGVLFHTHHVVRPFHTRKARKESKKILPFILLSLLPITSCKYIKGTKAMKINNANPLVGHAAAIMSPLNKANEILVIFFIYFILK